MIISILQVFGILLGIGIIYEARVLLKHDRFKRQDWLMWTSIGILTIIFSLFPTLSIYFATFAQLQRGLDVFIIVAIFGVYVLVFQVYIRIQETNRQVTDLVRQVALKLKEQK